VRTKRQVRVSWNRSKYCLAHDGARTAGTLALGDGGDAVLAQVARQAAQDVVQLGRVRAGRRLRPIPRLLLLLLLLRWFHRLGVRRLHELLAGNLFYRCAIHRITTSAIGGLGVLLPGNCCHLKITRLEAVQSSGETRFTLNSDREDIRSSRSRLVAEAEGYLLRLKNGPPSHN